MSAVYINEDEVKDILSIDKTIELTMESFKEYTLGRAYNMQRRRLRIKKGALHILPAAIPYKGVMGYKAYTSFRSGLIFKVHLYSSESGEPIAIIEANELGRLRTAAASAVATKFLAKQNNEICSLFGAGFQAEKQLEALCKINNYKKIYLSSLHSDKGIMFAKKMEKIVDTRVTWDEDVEKIVSESDIITTITWANKPLFKHDWLRKGVHINAAGSNALIRAEIPEKTVEKADLIAVDNKDVAKVECGDILPSLEKGRIHWNEICEIGEVIAGYHPGRLNDEQLTIFESQGMGLQDIICAEFVFRIASENNVGIKLPF